MTTGAILIDDAGAVSFLNDAAKSLLDIPAEGQAAETMQARFPTLPIGDDIKKALAGDSTDIAEAEALEKIFSLSFVSLKREAKVFGALVWINDITAQKLLERSKSQFIAIASHEMRTPLAIIRSNAELLLDEKAIAENAESTEEIGRILRGSVRLLGIVNDFLDVENLEYNKIALKREPVDLVQLLDEVVTDLSKIADKKHISCELKKPPTPIPPVLLDRSRVQQIFVNLISNAIHYTENGGVTVTMESNGGTVSVFVEDTGAGMDAEDQARLFKKFETGKAFLKSKEYGSGLGLYISRLLANRMGMTIKLEKSELGKGSTFSLSIPILREQV